MASRTASPIHKLRTDLGLSPATFARLLGASERSIRLWESGEEPGTREAPVARERECARAALHSEGAEGAADESDDVGCQCLPDDAADVVRAEDFVR